MNLFVFLAEVVEGYCRLHPLASGRFRESQDSSWGASVVGRESLSRASLKRSIAMNLVFAPFFKFARMRELSGKSGLPWGERFENRDLRAAACGF